MTEESSGSDEDEERQSEPPTAEDVEAAREELAAVGAGDADGDAEVADEDATAPSEADSQGADEGSDMQAADDDAPAADADAPAADAGEDDGAAPESEAGESDATDDEPVHAEDLVESPEERAVAGASPATETEDAPGTADGAVPADERATDDGTDAATEDATAADADAADGTGAATGGAGAPASDAGAAASEADAAASEADAPASEPDATDADEREDADEPDASVAEPDHQPGVPEDVRKYDRFKKVDGAQYERVNEFLRDRTYVTAREWAIARLCSDFRTETGVEMTKIGENLPELVPFMTDTYTPQAVNQARASFEEKVRTAGATFLYGAMCDFFTAEELDDVMYEATEVAKFLLEVEGVELSVEEELEAEDRISAVMREVRESSAELRHEECPECGADLGAGD